MEIRLLGPPGVRDGPDQRKVAGRQGALLAALTLQARQPVSVDRLLDVVWSDDPPVNGAGALQQRISRLRDVVDPARRGDVLVRAADGYRLHVDDGQVDLRRFERLSSAGRRQLADGDLRGAEATLRQALGLWSGPALAGFSEEPWAVAECRRLEELRLAATEDRLEALVGLGDHDRVVGELTELVAAHPLRERLRGQLMLALYGTGRQADALRVYDETRQLLAEELGVDPGPQLQRIHRQILTQDTSLEPDAPSPSSAARGNLPASHRRVVGRDHALDRITQLLRHTRLLTITGPGGAGKTTLAVEAARHHPTPADGTYLVELAPVSTPEAVVTTIAGVLGLAGSGGFGGGNVDATALTRALADKRMLVLLDNCEHVVDRVSSVVEQLLASAGDVQILATSREPLGVAGEVVWSVPGLGVPDEAHVSAEQVMRAPAVVLLVERARAHTPEFALSAENAAAAATLVRRLDGIPLAIELAAARLRVLSLSEVIDGLDDRFRLLTGHVRTAPSRQRTLQSTLDWSWDLLDEPLRRACAALAVPADRFDLQTASALLDASDVDAEALDVVTDLVDRSLLEAKTAAPTRYRMLESIRDYGRQRLDEHGRRDDVHARHADVVEAALRSCHGRTSPQRFDVDVEGLSAWLDDARTALRWADERGDRPRVQRIAGLLGWLWLLRGSSAEGVGWLDRGGLADPGAVDPTVVDGPAALWALALRAAGTLTPDAGRWADLAVRTAATPTDRILAQVCAAGHEAHTGRVAEAAETLAACTAEGQRIGGWPFGFVQLIAGQLAWVTGRVQTARRLGEEAVALLSAAGAEWAQVHALEILIDAAAARGDAVSARELALEGLRLCRRQRYPELEAAMLTRSALAAHALGDDEHAARQLDEAVTGAAAVGAESVLADAHTGAGVVARRRGAIRLAQHHLERASQLLPEAEVVPARARVHAELARTAALSDRPEVALAHARDALGTARRTGDPRTLVTTVEALAAALTISDDPQPAVALLATATAVREAFAMAASPPEQRDVESIVERLRNRVDDDAFEQVWSSGLEWAAERAGEIVAGDLDIRAAVTGA